MKKYLISYDLDRPGQDYHRLIAELERLGAVRVLYSQWLLRVNNTAAEVRDHLKAFIDGNDMLFVVTLTGEAAWTSLMATNDMVKQLLAA